MELYVFDRELGFKGLLEGYYSLSWVRRYSKCGEFELNCGLTPKALELLQRENIIYKKDGVEAGYIEYRNISEDAEGKEVLKIKGKFLTGYLGRRIIWGTENINTTTELAIRGLVNNNCINPVDSNRKIDLLMLGGVKGYVQAIDYQVSYKNLLTEIEGLATKSELGYRTLLDIASKQMIFDIYEGINRTASNGITAPAIFSKEFDNILSQEYTDSLNNFRNYALVAGEGEGEARETTTTGTGSGLDRFELFVDAKDLKKDALTTPQYALKLAERGDIKLAELTDIKTFESKANINSNLKYKTDFDLGDIVTCTSKKWGVTIDTRITEIEEVYEEQGMQVNVCFGGNVPTLIDKIKQSI